MMTPWEQFKHDFKGKKVLVMGLGIQGGGTEVARTFVDAGAQVTVTDAKDKSALDLSVKSLKDLPIKFVLGEHRIEDFISHDVIIRNPGVSESSEFLQIAKEKGIPIKMESALFTKYASGKLIGITGTRGKSTTTHLITHVLTCAGKAPIIAGNLPGKAALPLLQAITADSLIVLELSSWQLQGFATEKISPHIAVFTSIYPDHLNRYSSMETYIKDKTYIFEFQKPQDYAVLNRENTAVAALASQVPSQVIWFSYHDLPQNIHLKIPGLHNRENAAAARATCLLLGIEENEITSAISNFEGVPFRLQTIATIKDVTIINDTTSTTPIATVKAIQAIKAPITLILGGETKHLPTEELVREVNRLVDKLVLLSGSGTEEIKPYLKSESILTETKNLEKAIRTALDNTGPEGTVLFSPGFTSFGLFLNEFDRGETFNRLVKELAHEKST